MVRTYHKALYREEEYIMKTKVGAVIVALAIAIGVIFAAGLASASDQKVFNWRLVSTFPKGMTYITASDKYFCERVRILSQGKLNIKFFGAGELCAAPEVLDMVSKGTVEAGSDAAAYWCGKNTGFDLLTSSTLLMSGADYMTWIYQAGGFEVYNYMYGKYNCVYFPYTISQMESGIHSTKPIKKLGDLKGMKIRMPALLPGKIIAEYGAAPVPIAAAELYEALRRGVIDGVEWSAPVNDKEFHMEEMTKYWLAPGWHQPSAVYGVLINKDAYDALPQLLKEIIFSAARDTMVQGFTMYAYEDAKATKYFLDSDHVIYRLSDEELDELERVKNKIQEELAAKNPDYAKVLKSQLDYIKTFAPYREAAQPFTFGRNPKVYPNIK